MARLKLALTLILTITAGASRAAPDMAAIVETHILPGYDRLAHSSAALAEQAQAECSAQSSDLIEAFHTAFDAWIGVSHLRFGPSEKQGRAFALAFWPDPRSAAPKALKGLIRAQDPAVFDPTDFAAVSVAARGLYALEYLLFDPAFAPQDGGADAAYHCALVRAVTTDIAANAEAIRQDWRNGYGALLAAPGNETYRTEKEAARQMFTALGTGVEFNASARLGRPMGTLERPRPKRAEARRSGRSLRHVVLSLQALKDLAVLIAGQEKAAIIARFDTTLDRAKRLEDPVFAGVSTPQGRFRVEALRQSVEEIRQFLAQDLGPTLGIAAGFNALDGD